MIAEASARFPRSWHHEAYMDTLAAVTWAVGPGGGRRSLIMLHYGAISGMLSRSRVETEVVDEEHQKPRGCP